VAPPFREAEFDIMYGEGVSREGDILDLAVKHELVEKSGSWYSFQSERIGQGRENAKQFLRDHPDLTDTLDTELRKVLGVVKPLGENGDAVEAPKASNGAKGKG
jgi:recombination protein RecA